MRLRASFAAVLLLAAFAACTDEQPMDPGRALPSFNGTATLSSTEALGKAIFLDENLSLNSNQSCASCHAPAAGWVGPNSDVNAHGAVYEGSIAGAFGDRKPPSAAYATQSPILHFVLEKGGPLFMGGNFWDGRATGDRLGSPAAEQALGPFLNPKEQALPTAAAVVGRICAGAYGDDFVEVWGDDICDGENVDEAYDAVGYSVAAYEASSEVNAFSSKYDYYLAGMANLTQQERQGLQLFKSKGKCSKCHLLGGKGDPGLLTDYTFDNLGIPKNPENPFYEEDPDYVDQGLGGFLASRADYAAYADGARGAHKVPTLRNVDLRPSSGFVKAFGHNGFFKSLEEIVHFYNTRDAKPMCMGDFTSAQALAAGCWPAPEVAQNVNTAELGNLHLTPAQEADIVAFLKTLSDGYVP
jgi:cytochrome c peroxidase